MSTCMVWYLWYIYNYIGHGGYIVPPVCRLASRFSFTMNVSHILLIFIKHQNIGKRIHLYKWIQTCQTHRHIIQNVYSERELIHIYTHGRYFLFFCRCCCNVFATTGAAAAAPYRRLWVGVQPFTNEMEIFDKRRVRMYMSPLYACVWREFCTNFRDYIFHYESVGRNGMEWQRINRTKLHFGCIQPPGN